MNVLTDYRKLGALLRGEETLFRVWAPRLEQLEVVLPEETIPMQRTAGGYFEALGRAPAGTRYRLKVDGDQMFPDPASRYQPDGVHGPSEVVDPADYEWRSTDYVGIPQQDLVFYEAHTGTFTPEGTFDGIRSRLPHLRDLGVTALELMPVADFPGRWGWGYDHAALYAPSRVYGRPEDLRGLVDEAHQHGLAVFLDVIYNHLGPDGAYVAAFAPMFTDKHSTPWGPAINLDDEHSEGVRSFFIDNAIHWLTEYRFDGLRLDATHALVDDSDVHFLEELAVAVEGIGEGPPRLLIAEDSRNVNTLIRSRADGGYGLHGMWTDDFHHLVRHITTGESDGYFADFASLGLDALARTVERGWYYEGQRAPRTGKPRGTDASVVRPEQCVICIQNHDQIGNRPQGDRLNHAIPSPLYRAVSCLLLFAPELPLLFMGQEWASTSPFQFFTDHNEELGRLVTEGRKKEFEDFLGFGEDVPDPQHPAAFERSRLLWDELDVEPHRGMLELYRDLLKLRKALMGPAYAEAPNRDALVVTRGEHTLYLAFQTDVSIPLPKEADIVLNTEDSRYTPKRLEPLRKNGTLAFRRAGAVIAAQPAD